MIVFRKSCPSCISLGDAGTLSIFAFAPDNRERRHVCMGVNAASTQLDPAVLIVGVWNPPSVSMGDCNVVSTGEAGALPAPHTATSPIIFTKNDRHEKFLLRTRCLHHAPLAEGLPESTTGCAVPSAALGVK